MSREIANPVPRYRLEDLLSEAERLGPENRPPFEDFDILASEWRDDDWSDIAPNDEEMGVKNASDPQSG